ncbi:MAG: hypothetical protein ACFE8L_13300 [Candidatus Hodarchaeota archaeon]
MKKRNISLAVFSIIFFLSLIYFLPVARGYDYIFDDAEDDVYRYCEDTDETVIGDYRDEIDIVQLNITGQYVNLTVAGDLAGWSDFHWGFLTFSEEFIPWEGELNYAWKAPYYRLEYEYNPPFFVTLEKGYSLGGGDFAYEVWNGTAWENQSTATPVNILSGISQHSIVAYIPDAVEEIPSSMECLLNTRYWPPPYNCTYADFVPALPSIEEDKIPSYNLFILICGMIGISILFVRKRNKLK